MDQKKNREQVRQDLLEEFGEALRSCSSCHKVSQDGAEVCIETTDSGLMVRFSPSDVAKEVAATVASAVLESFEEAIKTAEEITVDAKESQDWFSLPKVLASGVAFEFEQLEGRKAAIKHSDLNGQLEGKLTRLSYGEVDKPRGWSITLEGPADATSGLFCESWYGNWGWELLVEGPIPHPTADTLKPGFTFVGRCMGEEQDCIVTSLGSIENQETGEVLERKVVTGVTLRNPKENSETGPVNWVPKQVEVLRIYPSYGRFED